MVVGFAGVFWFVLIHKGVASATAEAFNRPGLFLLVFALAILSAGFHELGHATGVPDLYAHMGPTLSRLLPGRCREPSALPGWARFLVTTWVLIVVPVLLARSLTAIVVLPRLLTSAWDGGRHIILNMSHQAGHGQILAMLASLVSLAALLLPVFGSALVTQKVVRTVVAKGLSWSHGNPGRRLAMAIAGAAVIAGAVWAWWPAGQYQPVREDQKGTPPRRDQARLRPRRGGPAHDEPGAGVAHAGRASGPWR